MVEAFPWDPYRYIYCIDRVSDCVDLCVTVLCRDVVAMLRERQVGLIEPVYCGISPICCSSNSTGMEVSVKTADCRNAQFVCGVHGRPAQRAFGRNVDRIGAIIFPLPGQTSPGWHANTQLFVHRDAEAGNQAFCISAVDSRLVLQHFGRDGRVRPGDPVPERRRPDVSVSWQHR